jgi:hypothetical protein
MRKFAAVIILLFVISTSQAIETSKIQGMIATFTITGTVSVNKGNLLYVYLNLSVPQLTDYQITHYSGRSGVDSNGNRYALIEVAHPSNPFTYSITTTTIMKGRRTKDLPSSYTVPEDIVKYTSLTERINGDSPKIRELALNLTANSTSDFEKVAKLAIYVNKLITYDLEYVNKWENATWILENKKGVCVEYSTLFAALTRSLGIPTRRLVGYAYDSSTDSMMGHAWNEVYIGKWVPVDSLWMEIGYLDGGHVEAARGIDDEFFVSPIFIWQDWGEAEATFKASTADPTYGSEVTLRNVTYFEKEKDYEIKVSPENIIRGDSTKLELSLVGKDYRVVSVKAIPQCSGLTVDETEKLMIVGEGKNVGTSWLLKAENLDANLQSCQINLESDYLEGKNFTLAIANPQGGPNQNGNSGNANVTHEGEKPKLIPCLPIVILSAMLIAALFMRFEKSRHEH